MEKAQRETLKKRILEEIESLRKHVASMESNASSVEPDVAIGRLSRMDTMVNQSIADASLSQSKQRILNLERAMVRIDEDPEFGECEECGEPIPIGRLLALPEAQLCVECAE